MKLKIIDSGRYAGVAAILIQLGIITFVATRTSFDLFGNNPISNLGTTSFFPAYAVAFIAGGMALLVMLVYLQVTYRPTKWFVITMAAGILGEILTGIVPDNLSNSRIPFETLTAMHVHGAAAAVLFLSIPASILLFSKSAQNPVMAERSRRYLWVYVATFIPAVILMHLHILYSVSELVSLLIFDAWILQLTQPTFYTAIARKYQSTKAILTR